MDDFPDELKVLTHVHWEAFPPQHPFINHILAIFMVLLWILSFVGNFLVMSLILTSKRLRTPVSMKPIHICTLQMSL